MMPSNTPQPKHNLKCLSCVVCLVLFIPEYAQRASQSAFFLWGSRASYVPYHQKDVTHATRYHGEEPLHALLMLHFFPLFFYLENKDTIFFYMWKAPSTFTSALTTFVYSFFLFRAAKKIYCQISLY